MEDLLAGSRVLALVVDVLSAVAITIGLFHVVLTLARRALRREELPGAATRIALGRWLALSLELALAADVVATIVSPTWDELGKLGAIATLRTVLSWSLGREIREAARGPERVATNQE